MESKNYRDKLAALLSKAFVAAGYKITKPVELDPVIESSTYEALIFAIDNKNIVYRKGKVTPDRPGAFLAVWQRPPSSNNTANKPIPLNAIDVDYLFVQVDIHSADEDSAANERLLNSVKSGLFIFPVTVLVEKGIVSSSNKKGKTGFRVFPPWSQDRGQVGTKVFSDSGKKTQRWQSPYFVEIDEHGCIDSGKLTKLLKSSS